jgi:uncharacterized damage-inducible protein DinB
MADPRYPIGKFSPPAEYTPAARAASIHEIATAPALLRSAVHGLSSEQRLTPYRDGGWTVAQVIHHVADSHMHAYARMKLAVTEDVPAIKAYDENVWASLPDASAADLELSLTLIDALHGRWTTFLRHLSPQNFDRGLMHPERGPMTLDRLVALYGWHGRHHAAHVTALRARMGW